MKKIIIVPVIILVVFLSVNLAQDMQVKRIKSKEVTPKIIKSEDEWKNLLTPLQFEVTRKKGTETPFSGMYYDFYEKGKYHCIGCDAFLFDSSSKFKSGCGWPSFRDVADIN